VSLLSAMVWHVCVHAAVSAKACSLHCRCALRTCPGCSCFLGPLSHVSDEHLLPRRPPSSQWCSHVVSRAAAAPISCRATAIACTHHAPLHCMHSHITIALHLSNTNAAKNTCQEAPWTRESVKANGKQCSPGPWMKGAKRSALHKGASAHAKSATRPHCVLR
jgi:hypothetical protein